MPFRRLGEHWPVLGRRGLGYGMVGGGESNPFTIPNPTVYWSFENTWVDVVKGNELSPIRSPTFTTGKVNQGSAYVRASRQYAGMASNSDLQAGLGVDWMIGAWVKVNSLGIFNTIASKWGTANEYLFIVNTSNNPQLYITDNTGPKNVISNVTVETGIWYLIFAWYSSLTSRIYIQTNSEPVVNSTLVDSGIIASTDPFNVGSFGNGASNNYYMDGIIDELGIWK